MQSEPKNSEVEWKSIRATALAATPGPWHRDAFLHRDGSETENVHARSWDVAVCEARAGDAFPEDDETRPAQAAANAAHIAAFNPAAVLALLDDLDEARRQIDAVRALADRHVNTGLSDGFGGDACDYCGGSWATQFGWPHGCIERRSLLAALDGIKATSE